MTETLKSDSDQNWEEPVATSVESIPPMEISDTPELTEEEYAQIFWDHNKDKADEVQRVMTKTIHDGEKKDGTIRIFTDPKGASLGDWEKMAAYRTLAKELGYDIGDFKIHTKRNTFATAKLRKPINRG